MILAIPKEVLAGEDRVAATPETVKKYVDLGFTVLVESGAGQAALCSDADYEAVGARLEPDAERLFSEADLILKVKQPEFNRTKGRHEVDMMRQGTMLITFLHPAAPPNHDMVRMLRDKGITAFTMDGIPRTSRAQRMDALTSMSTVTGYRSVLMAAGHFPKFIPMIGTAIGTVKPAKLLVVGIGVVGLQAIATAKRLGGVVKAVDIREDARNAAQSLGVKVAGFDVPPELAMAAGGYARSLPADWLEKERVALKPVVEESDIVILCALVPGEVAPVLVTRDMVRNMKPGSVIIDVSIDQGGNCEVTKAGEESVVHGVFVGGRLNIPGSMPVDASWLYSNNMYYYVENLFKRGVGTPDLDDEIVRHSLVTHRGEILHAGALKAMAGV